MDNTIMEDNTLRNFDLIMAMCHIIQAEANKIDRCSIQVLATTKDEYMKDTFLEHQEFVENIVRKLDDITAEIFEFENAAAYVNEIDIEMYKPILDQLEEWRKNHKIEEKIDLEKESELIANGIMIDVQANKYNTVVYNTKRNDFNHSHLMLAARKGIELGLKASNPTTAVDQENEWHESSVKPPFTLTMDGNRYSKPMLCYDKFGNYCIAQYARMQTGYCGWYDGYEEVNITHWKELKEVKKGE